MNLDADDPLMPAILRGFETAFCYYAERSLVDGTVVFTCPEVPFYTLARIDRIADDAADAARAAWCRHFEARGCGPRVRLTPLSTPADWPERLARAGFVETDGERYWIVPPEVQLGPNPAVTVREVANVPEADAFSAIQALGYDLTPAQQALDRRLARRAIVERRYHVYLAAVDGEPAGGAYRVDAENGLTGLFGLATHPNYRGRGVGTAILRQMIEDARRNRDAPIFFTTDVGASVEDWYVRIGFTPLFLGRTFVC
jgi:GNAT superfamily N-acetyltransferase